MNKLIEELRTTRDKAESFYLTHDPQGPFAGIATGIQVGLNDAIRRLESLLVSPEPVDLASLKAGDVVHWMTDRGKVRSGKYQTHDKDGNYMEIDHYDTMLRPLHLSSEDARQAQASKLRKQADALTEGS